MEVNQSWEYSIKSNKNSKSSKNYLIENHVSIFSEKLQHLQAQRENKVSKLNYALNKAEKKKEKEKDKTE